MHKQDAQRHVTIWRRQVNGCARASVLVQGREAAKMYHAHLHASSQADHRRRQAQRSLPEAVRHVCSTENHRSAQPDAAGCHMQPWRWHCLSLHSAAQLRLLCSHQHLYSPSELRIQAPVHLLSHSPKLCCSLHRIARCPRRSHRLHRSSPSDSASHARKILCKHAQLICAPADGRLGTLSTTA